MPTGQMIIGSAPVRGSATTFRATNPATGEEMEPVAMVLPLAPSASALPRTPENLRACRRCDQLIGLDVSDCPYCGLRQQAV